MKKCLLLYFLSAYCLFAQAQVVINSTDLPIPGKSYLLGATTNGIGSLSPGAEGNTTWDFSGLTKSATDTGGVLSLSQTPFPTAFPSATHANFNKDSVGDTYSYYTLSPTKAELTGLMFLSSSAFNFPTTKLNTIKALDFYTLPLQDGLATSSFGVYNGKEAYNYNGLGLNVDSVEFTMHLEKHDTVTASGSITTPTNTYDAIRLKTVVKRKLLIKARNSGAWMDLAALFPPEPLKVTSYNWWAKNIGVEVFSLWYEDSTSNVPTKATWYESEYTLGIDDQDFDASITKFSPNPASDMLTISPSVSTAYNLLIATVEGREVMRKKGLFGVQQVDVQSLQSGLYVVTLSSGNGKSLKSKVVVQR